MSKFADYFVWRVERAEDGKVVVAAGTGSKVFVPRDEPGKYMARVMAKPPTPQDGSAAPDPTIEIARINVWVV